MEIENSVWFQLAIGIPLMYVFFLVFKKLIAPRYYVISGIIILTAASTVFYFLKPLNWIGITYLALCASAAGLIVEKIRIR